MPLLTFPANRETTLPAGSVILRVITGDSLAGVLDIRSSTDTGVGLADLDDSSLRGNRDAVSNTTRPDGAFYWSKWLHKESGGYANTRRFVNSAETDNTWERLTDRSGWNASGPYTSIESAPDMPLMFAIHEWAEQLGHGYRDETGAKVPVYYICCSYSGSIHRSDAAANISWNMATSSSIAQQFRDNYLVPGIASLRTIAKTRRNAYAPDSVVPRIYCDMFVHTAGGSDSHVSFGSSAGATALGTNYQRTIDDLHDVLGCRPPTLVLRPFDPGYVLTSGSVNQFPHVSLAITSFDAWMTAAASDGQDAYLIPFRMNAGIETQELVYGVTNYTITYGVHPTANGMVEMARRIVQALADASGSEHSASTQLVTLRQVP